MKTFTVHYGTMRPTTLTRPSYNENGEVISTTKRNTTQERGKKCPPSTHENESRRNSAN